MPSIPTPNLLLELQATGESLNSWGERLNNTILLVEQAVAGVFKKELVGDLVLAVQNYAADDARNAVLIFTAATSLSSAPTITVPPRPKTWHIINRTSHPLSFTMGGPPVSVPVGRQGILVCDGSTLTIFEPVAEAAAVSQVYASQAGTSAASAASAAGTATTARNAAQDARDDARAVRDTTISYRDTTLGYRNAAAASAASAASSAASVDGPAISSRIGAVEGGKVSKAGDAMTGALSSAVKDHGTLGAVTEAYAYADANTHTVTIAASGGTHTINPTGLSEGGVMQINLRYTSGAVAVSGATQWEISGGEKSADIAGVGVALATGAAYRIIFEMVGGVRTGIFQ